MKELLQNIIIICKWIFTEMIPAISEMQKATYGPLGDIIEVIKNIITYGIIIIGALKILNKHSDI